MRCSSPLQRWSPDADIDSGNRRCHRVGKRPGEYMGGTRAWRRRLIAVLVSSMVTAAGLTAQTSAAGYSDSTSNAGDAWAAGAVQLDDDNPSSLPLFSTGPSRN